MTWAAVGVGGATLVGGLIASNNRSGGNGINSADIKRVFSPDTATAQNKQTQTAIGQQGDFLNAIQAQNGIGNQSQVYNQLQGVVNGTGPNPAQAQLAQATGANVANQAAQAAGQRGANANVGLIARQTGMNGANIQQQAANQAATLQAQQSLSALQGAGNIATNQVANQANATGAVTAANQTQEQMILQEIANQNNAAVGAQSSVNSANAGLTGQLRGQQGDAIGGIANGLGGVMSSMGGANGTASGKTSWNSPSDNSWSNIPTASANKWAEGGEIPQYAGKSSFGQFLAMKNSQSPPKMAEGGKVPAMVSPGEQYLSPKAVEKVAKEGKNPLSVGERIPGKPKHPGNNYANDVVPKTLEAGGVVIPNSIMQSKDPAHEAYKFVQATMAKSGKQLPKKSK